MELVFRAVSEDSPGPKWKALFDRFWPSYRAWFLSEGAEKRPTYLQCKRALKEHMPELVPVYERIVDLAGGGDVEARFLSLYCPAPYLGGCSQVCWLKDQYPVLIRNYDYSAPLCEAAVLKTSWTSGHGGGGAVIAMSDCAWGALDGINASGLAVSLAFGGRKVVGQGFGIPLVLRYVLETCSDVVAATRVLSRVPVHMAYNVSVIDRRGRAATVFVAPDCPARVTEDRVATNHQERIEWPEHAEVTRTIERSTFLAGRLEEPSETAAHLAEAFLTDPIFLGDYARGWGTLYTAIYKSGEREAEYRWRALSPWRFSFDEFEEREQRVRYD